jgi:hypothetical protein
MRAILSTTASPHVTDAVLVPYTASSFGSTLPRASESDLSEQEFVFDITPGVEVLTGLATFPDIAGGENEQSHAPHFVFSLDDTVDCGAGSNFILSMMSDQGPSTTRLRMPAACCGTFVFAAGAALGWPDAADYTDQGAIDDTHIAACPEQDPRGPRKMSLLTRLSGFNYSAVGTTPSPSQRAFSSVSRGG